ncbi:MAG TPA: VIT1/CCC1 transporter family protein [Sphingomicrobium sp.]|nr:VIT1/CCC1 transporter family protein [Sphingomicrobium sp.]
MRRAESQQLTKARQAEFADRLNWLRAAVLGANDGVVSTASMMFGVAGAAANSSTILVAGSAAVAAGAMSMAAAEYVSVSSQRDYQQSEISQQKARIAADVEGALDDLTDLVVARGIEASLARQVAVQLTKEDALNAHTRLRLGFERDQLTNPWHAALASLCSFVLGGLVPLAAVLFGGARSEMPATAAAAVVALVLTGSFSAQLGHAPKLRAALRTVIGGILAMAVTYAVGSIIGSMRA